jgi:hypothetical protein
MCSAPLTLLDWRLRARTVDTSDQCLVHLPGCCCTELPKACNYEWDLWLGTSSGCSGLGSPGVTCYCQHLFCRSHFILPWTQGGPPSTPSTPVVVAAENPDSIPQGARHRRLQHRWWSLSDLPPAPTRGPAIDVFNFRWWPLPDLPPAPPKRPTIDISNFGGGRCWTYRQHPQGARH